MILPLVCGVAVVLTLIGEWLEINPLKIPAKAIASFAFVGFGVQCGALETGLPGYLILAGLILSTAGDLFLLSRESKPFLAGLGSFLLAHVAYAVAFVVMGVDPVLSVLTLVPMAGIGWSVWKWVSPNAGKMGPAVVGYICVISVMVALAAGGAAMELHPARLALLVAAQLFFASDLFVARDRFVERTPINRTVGLPLYYLAQLGFGVGLSFYRDIPSIFA